MAFALSRSGKTGEQSYSTVDGAGILRSKIVEGWLRRALPDRVERVPIDHAWLTSDASLRFKPSVPIPNGPMVTEAVHAVPTTRIPNSRLTRAMRLRMAEHLVRIRRGGRPELWMRGPRMSAVQTSDPSY